MPKLVDCASTIYLKQFRPVNSAFANTMCNPILMPVQHGFLEGLKKTSYRRKPSSQSPGKQDCRFSNELRKARGRTESESKCRDCLKSDFSSMLHCNSKKLLEPRSPGTDTIARASARLPQIGCLVTDYLSISVSLAPYTSYTPPLMLAPFTPP